MSTPYPPSDPGDQWRPQQQPGSQWQSPPPWQQPAGPAQGYGQGQPPYGQPPAGQWPPHGGQWQPPARPPSKAGPILALVGALMIVAGIALGVVVGQTLTGIVPSPGDITPVAGETVVEISSGETLILYAPSSMLPVCDIIGPTEAVPSIDLGGSNYEFPLGEVPYESVARIGGPGEPAGEYTVVCEEDGLIIAPPLDVGEIVGSVGGLLGVIALGSIGFVLLVVGLIVWLLGRRRA